MKSILVLTLFMALANCAMDEELWNAMSAKDQKMFDECTMELKLEDKTSESITETEVKCLVKCVLEKGNEMKDGVLVEENIKKGIEETEKIPEEIKKKSIAEIPHCIEETKIIVDQCEKAFAFTGCLVKAAT